MTKKDFIAIAMVFKHQPYYRDTPAAREERMNLASGVAFRLKQQYPRFDYNRFMEACGFPQG